MDSYFWLVGVVLFISVTLVGVAWSAWWIQRKRQAKQFRDLERDVDSK